MSVDLRLNMNDYLPLRDVVFNTLRTAILSGQLKPGDRLMEVHLAREMGVSRTPIREAIRKLELEGLVVMMPRRGATVANMTEKSLQDVLEVRNALDQLIAELACERISKEQIEELKTAAEEFEKAVKSYTGSENDIVLMAKKDELFHAILTEATGNMRLKSLVNNLSEQMYRYRFVYLMNEESHSKLVIEHENIYEAVKNRDAIRAKEAAGLHIDNQKRDILWHIKSGNEV